MSHCGCGEERERWRQGTEKRRRRWKEKAEKPLWDEDLDKTDPSFLNREPGLLFIKLLRKI